MYRWVGHWLVPGVFIATSAGTKARATAAATSSPRSRTLDHVSTTGSGTTP